MYTRAKADKALKDVKSQLSPEAVLLPNGASGPLSGLPKDLCALPAGALQGPAPGLSRIGGRYPSDTLSSS